MLVVLLWLGELFRHFEHGKPSGQQATPSSCPNLVHFPLNCFQTIRKSLLPFIDGIFSPASLAGQPNADPVGNIVEEMLLQRPVRASEIPILADVGKFPRRCRLGLSLRELQLHVARARNDRCGKVLPEVRGGLCDAHNLAMPVGVGSVQAFRIQAQQLLGIHGRHHCRRNLLKVVIIENTRVLPACQLLEAFDAMAVKVLPLARYLAKERGQGHGQSFTFTGIRLAQSLASGLRC
mmetsp:Transcript_42569/g.92891  ORF Transcript_42569/g.92891 Transcript_42569/m.92891 type:complete len:236 (-) Transcript_42569:1000-1707(-)